MFKELQKYTIDYVMMYGILIALLFLYFFYNPDLVSQRIIAISGGVFYFFWGLLHHSKIKDLTEKIVLEYFFISLFASSVLYLLTM